jgi:holo-[acyl-carrier protein] synthase
MILGIGIDAVETGRLEKWAANPEILNRFFDPQEIAAVRERGKGMVKSLAARFAAKEAFGKALGTGLAGLVLKDIAVAGSVNEKPVLVLKGSALAAMRALGAEKAHISLTHDGNMAMAMVILEA